MKILIDIAHPANVHYFKNFIWKITENGHSVIITAKNKDLVYRLLDAYKFKYYKLGTSNKTFLSRILFIIKSTARLIKIIKKEKPDIAVSFATSYCALSAFFMRIPYFAFDDTEHARLNRCLYLPFTKKVFTPASYKLELGKKQYKFNAFMELFYLHPDIFKPDSRIRESLGVRENESYAIIRFISWDAFHDVGHQGLSKNDRLDIVNSVSKHMKVFVSVEGSCPPELESYRLNTSPEDIHQALFFASFYIGEGATTASECAMLGTPAIYINPLSAGTLEKLRESGLLWIIKNDSNMISEIKKLVQISELKDLVGRRSRKFIKNMINPTDFFLNCFEDNKKWTQKNNCSV